MRFLLYFLIAMFFLPLTGCTSPEALAILDEATKTGGKVKDATIGNAHKALDAYCEKVPKVARLSLRALMVTPEGNRIEATCVGDTAGVDGPAGQEVVGSSDSISSPAGSPVKTAQAARDSPYPIGSSSGGKGAAANK